MAQAGLAPVCAVPSLLPSSTTMISQSWVTRDRAESASIAAAMAALRYTPAAPAKYSATAAGETVGKLRGAAIILGGASMRFSNTRNSIEPGRENFKGWRCKHASTAPWRAASL
jgi:hypothetical protein